MAVTKQQAIEIMKTRGYGQVSEAGSGVWVGFSKDMNGIWISAQVDLIKESVTMSGGILKLMCELKVNSFDLHHKRFEDFEKALYFYAKVCSLIDTFTEDERFIGRHTEVALDEYPVSKVTAKDGVNDGVNDGVKKTEKKDIKTRKREFWDKVVVAGKEKGYAKEMCLEFHSYWTEMNDGGKKLRFEMEKIFDVNRRLTTWLQHDKKWSKTFVEKKAEVQNKEITTNKTINKKDLF